MRPWPQPRASCGPRYSVSSSLQSPWWVGGRTAAQARAKLRPDADQAVGGKKDDGEEHAADHEVEAFAADQVDREVLQQDEYDGADEGTDRAVHAAEHGDDQDVDHRSGVHGAGRDAVG